jgi:2-polyprenyl-6-methoxyphenol hydroxylase-like FAD-dependent oxidoreductase
MAVGACLITGYRKTKLEIWSLLTHFSSSGTGYIGSFTALALLEAGYKVVITDNLYNSSAEVVNRIELICGKRPFFEKLDITDEKAFDAVFDKHPDIDSVIHFAALKVRKQSWNCRTLFKDLNISDSILGCWGERREASRLLLRQCLWQPLPPSFDDPT